MSELRVDSVKSKGGGAPDLPKGVTISGITTAATLGATQIDVSNVNVSGVVTSGTLSGSLLSTGTPTLGLGVTINSSGVAISGVATAGIVSATTLYGDGTNLTGIGASIAPLFYQPDPYDSGVVLDAGIGITFNSQVKAGSGEVTLRLVGAAGTVVENFGVGSSVTISENRITINPTADLSLDTVYHINYPSGCFTNNEGTDYVGTAYTFEAKPIYNQLWAWGYNGSGNLGLNDIVYRSSPVQVPGNTWSKPARGWGDADGSGEAHSGLTTKTDGTLWSWGRGENGQLGLNDVIARSSPTQIPGTTWGTHQFIGGQQRGAIKTDGTLWVWGVNTSGTLGQNNRTNYSSPVQIPGTTWKWVEFGNATSMGVKTDGTLWSWGYSRFGELAQNNNVKYSSPVQIPGTWSTCAAGYYHMLAIRTNGTLWVWGDDSYGSLAQNPVDVRRSSPVQIPGTTWASCSGGKHTSMATKTDGTLWTWGGGNYGAQGDNSITRRSSPVQLPGTTWSQTQGDSSIHSGNAAAMKTDGTLWAWGSSGSGQNAQNDRTQYSSPVQIPGTWVMARSNANHIFATKTA
jgi:alpha-tubulin suppressor-like RCC1 family protein